MRNIFPFPAEGYNLRQGKDTPLRQRSLAHISAAASQRFCRARRAESFSEPMSCARLCRPGHGQRMPQVQASHGAGQCSWGQTILCQFGPREHCPGRACRFEPADAWTHFLSGRHKKSNELAPGKEMTEKLTSLGPRDFLFMGAQ